MHSENWNGAFDITNPNDLVQGQYAFLGADWNDFFFVFRNNQSELCLKWIQTIEDSDISDRMWEDFDDYEEWKDAVQRGDTEDSYDNRRQDIDIREYKSSGDYYDCPSDVPDILYDLDLWNSTYDSDNWYYLDTYDTSVVCKASLERYGRNIVMDWSYPFNSELWYNLSKDYHINELEYLDCEDIR